MTDDPKKRDRFDELLLAFWLANVPGAYKGILSGDGWSWDEQRQGYRSATGTWLDGANLDALARSFLISAEVGIEKETVALLPRVDEWKPRVKEDALLILWALALLASGGNLDEPMRAFIQGEESTDEKLGWGKADLDMRLDNFADELCAGQAGSIKQIVNRSGQYAHGGWMVYQGVRRLSHQQAKDDYGRRLFLYERNILDPACHHCADSIIALGCPTVTKEGWRPIGELTRIGDRSCFANCRCRWEYNLFPEDFPAEE